MKKLWGVLLVLLLSMNAYALRVELSSDVFETTGRSSNRNLFVTNNSEKMIALEVYAQSRMMEAETGVDILEDIEDFLIYPNQLLLQPDEQQVVTLTWVGDQELTEERAFRIVVEELNLSLEEEEALEGEQMTVKLDALTKVVKAAYVAPANAKPNISIIAANVVETEDGAKKIELTFENSGTAHKIMKEVLINLTPIDGSGAEGAQKQFVPEELTGVLNILAKSQRIIQIGWPEGIDESYTSFKASL